MLASEWNDPRSSADMADEAVREFESMTDTKAAAPKNGLSSSPEKQPKNRRAAAFVEWMEAMDFDNQKLADAVVESERDEGPVGLNRESIVNRIVKFRNNGIPAFTAKSGDNKRLAERIAGIFGTTVAQLRIGPTKAADVPEDLYEQIELALKGPRRDFMIQAIEVSYMAARAIPGISKPN